MWDNGAFSLYTQKKAVDWDKFYTWVEPRLGHPHWAIVPDVIDGSEEDNLELAKQWPHRKDCACVVWHMGESIDQLFRLLDLGFGKVAFGSSGEYWQVGSEAWERRCDEAFNALARNGALPWVHMLRGLSLGGKHWPFASADSTNVAVNYKYNNTSPEYLARQIDSAQCPVTWTLKPEHRGLL